MTKALAEGHELIPISPMAIIQKAISNGQDVDLDKMQKFLELQESWERREAEKEYFAALARVHANIPVVNKSKFNPQTKSKYADLADVIRAIQPVYAKEGITVSFSEGGGAPEGHVRVIAEIAHAKGHKENGKYLDVPMDGKGIQGKANMTATHGKFSTLTYGQRKLECMIFNIATDDDDDGNAAVNYIDEKQQSIILEYLDDMGENKSKFFGFFGADDVSKIPSNRYQEALQMIEQRRKQKDAA